MKMTISLWDKDAKILLANGYLTARYLYLTAKYLYTQTHTEQKWKNSSILEKSIDRICHMNGSRSKSM